MEKQRIRFIDSVNNTLFYIFDGEDIEIEIKGEWVNFTCHYVDDFHFKLHNHVFNIIEFAQIRETFIQRYRPARREAEIAERKNQIRFVNTSGETFFCLDDGEEIEIEADGEWIRYTCRYMDGNHFKLEGRVYHIGEVARLMEKLVQRYRPAKKEAEFAVEPKKKIPFIDATNTALFYIDDGEDIEVEINGEWKRYTCKYIDDGHFKMGDGYYRVNEFAGIMKNASQRCRPITNKTRRNYAQPLL
jgi:hypothetical protein